MSRTIRYKQISKEMALMAKPREDSNTRVSIGLEREVGEYFFMSVDKLIPFKNQARKIFNEEELLSLADSIKEYGVRQPLTVIKSDDGQYEVVSGERRLIAAKKAGLERVPCIILKDDNQSDAIALIENIHRKNLHLIELGNAYKKLLENKVFQSQNELAAKVSVAISHVSECIKYASLPPEVQKDILMKGVKGRTGMRKIVNTYTRQNYDNTDQDVKKVNVQKKGFSVLRVTSDEGILKIQDKGISKLLNHEKEELRTRLMQILDSL